MFKPRLKHVFRSRWHALWWGAGICMTAYCSVPAAKQAPPPKPKPSVGAHHVAQWWEKTPAKS